jgi:putative transport protein
MDFIIELLASDRLILLFVVIGLGYLFGSIRIFGFNLGVSAVLFVGMALGALDPRLILPDYIYVIGLVLFVYAIGLQAGPGFFASFRKRGLRFSLAGVAILALGALATVLFGTLVGLPVPTMAGLFCGALTNTPALAATVETVRTMSAVLPAGQAGLITQSPIVAYGLAYPFGVFGVIMWFFVFMKIFRVNFAREEAARLAQLDDAIHSRTFRVTNPAVIDKRIGEVIALLPNSGFALSRIKKRDGIEIVTPDIVLAAGDQIVAVGPDDALERARLLFGEMSTEHIAEHRDDMSYRRIFVSNREVVGKTVGELQGRFQGTITRLRRGDVEFVPSSDTILELGDRILVVSRRAHVEHVSAFFGDSIKSISEADYLSISLGIVLGVLLGMIPFPLPGEMYFKLGFAGGPLVVGLILGRLERTGPVIWGMPFNANLVLRQIGLVFFMAGIGTVAGQGFGATFQSGGLSLIAIGALVTSLVTVATLLLAYRYFKLPMSAAMGMMSGLQTQPACLAYANQQANNELPNVWYATVYPAAMIAKIILAQIIITILLT